MKFMDATREIGRGFADWRRWAWLGYYDVRLQNRRSFFGMWWTTISRAIFVFGIGHLWAGLIGRPLDEYLPHIAVGYLVWQMFTGGISAGTGLFVDGKKILLEAILPVNTLALRKLVQILFQLFLSLLVPIAAFAYVGFMPSWQSIYAIPGFLLILLLTHGIMITLGIICARIRDIKFLIESVLRLFFFFTPILWIPSEQRSGRSILTDVNPFYYVIEVVRTPILKGEFPTFYFLVVTIFVIVANVAALLLFAAYRRRLIYWIG